MHYDESWLWYCLLVMLDQFFAVYLVDAISYFARGDYRVKLCIMRWFSCLKSKFVWIFQKCQSRIWWALTKLPNQWWNSNGVETKFVSAFVLGLFEGVTSFKLCIFISLLSPPPPSKKKKKFFKFYCVVYWKINILLLSGCVGVPFTYLYTILLAQLAIVWPECSCDWLCFSFF